MKKDKELKLFKDKYTALAKKSREERRMIFNHICIRVEDIDEAQKLISDTFGIDNFLSPGGETFDNEKEFRVAWLEENNMYLELSEFDQPQAIGYNTGVGQPIGHLSEIGFFVPDMDNAMNRLSEKGWEVTSKIETEGAKMVKVSNNNTPGIPVELIELQDLDGNSGF